MTFPTSRMPFSAISIAFAFLGILLPVSAHSQVKIQPEVSSADGRIEKLRKLFQAGDRATRRLDTYVDVQLPGKTKEQKTIERIVHGYLVEVGAEPLSFRDARNSTFRLEISSIQSRENGEIKQSIFMVLYDKSLSQGERPIMRSRTDLLCNVLVYRKDYHTFKPPADTCIRDEAQLREAFLRLK